MKDTSPLIYLEMPEVDEHCIPKVIGMAYLLEDKQDEFDQLSDFNQFFAKVYCQAYLGAYSSIVSPSGNLFRAKPGELDDQIDAELLRIQEHDGAQNGMVMKDFKVIAEAAIVAFIDAAKRKSLYQMSDYATFETKPF